ncbi:MAG: hypothetical protein O9302_07690 [Cyclobacteriaceae bacterium]|jgi:hypothetical protein|nr:hypothetical protein [Flammeovirgaceae bacterium]MCZ8021344.1 hypothetical protein [Cytophagales bacterium]MCZ8327924.1 hypothetical protein [Cyclobacteriaceae bacterium]
MKVTTYLFLLLAATTMACGNKSEHAHEGHDHSKHSAEKNSTATDSLFNAVMQIHDEVMPKMNDLYTMKDSLNKVIAALPAKAKTEKEKLEAEIKRIEEASESMMVWMREFNPPADSVGLEKVNEYLNTEMKKVQQVKENILGVIKKQ